MDALERDLPLRLLKRRKGKCHICMFREGWYKLVENASNKRLVIRLRGKVLVKMAEVTEKYHHSNTNF
jgi:hypothetical protein